MKRLTFVMLLLSLCLILGSTALAQSPPDDEDTCQDAAGAPIPCPTDEPRPTEPPQPEPPQPEQTQQEQPQPEQPSGTEPESEPTQARPLPSLMQGTCTIATFSDTAVNVRETPSLSGQIVGVLDPMQTYAVAIKLENAEGLWLGIDLGWVSADVVRQSAVCAGWPSIYVHEGFTPRIGTDMILEQLRRAKEKREDPPPPPPPPPSSSGPMPQTREHVLLAIEPVDADDDTTPHMAVIPFVDGDSMWLFITCLDDCRLDDDDDDDSTLPRFRVSKSGPTLFESTLALPDSDDFFPFFDIVLPDDSPLEPTLIANHPGDSMILDFKANIIEPDYGDGLCHLYNSGGGPTGDSLKGYGVSLGNSNQDVIDMLIYVWEHPYLGPNRDATFIFDYVFMLNGETLVYSASTASMFSNSTVVATMRDVYTNQLAATSPLQTLPGALSLVAPRDGIYEIEIALSIGPLSGGNILFEDVDWTWDDLGDDSVLNISISCFAAS